MIKEMEERLIALLGDDNGWQYNVNVEHLLQHDNGMLFTVCDEETPPYGKLRKPILMRLGREVTDAILERIVKEKSKTYPLRASDPEFIVQYMNGEWPYTVDVSKDDVKETPSVPYRHYVVEMRDLYRIYLRTEEDHLAVALMY